jgi:hypothetical protein
MSTDECTPSDRPGPPAHGVIRMPLTRSGTTG